MKQVIFTFAIILLFCPFALSQFVINGVVHDKNGEPIFAVNVYPKSDPQNGVISSLDGSFSLKNIALNDTLIVSYIGYAIRQIAVSTIDVSTKIIVVLKENSQTLEEIIITAQDPISEQFSVVKMKKLDIYLNPVSQGDPLKAISILPAATSTNETANPSLRGSSADRSRVILNGVPIYNPVRASQLNNQGFFSLFNAKIIDKQYVYASNPPLTYGNTSAGLVEVVTIPELEANQVQLSANLASTGIFLSQQIKKDISFIQAYGNFQFSEAYIGIQKEKTPNLKNFYTTDAGINFHSKLSKRSELNSYHYFIDESFKGHGQAFTYKGNIATSNKRMFMVNNFKLYGKHGTFSFNNGTNNAKSTYQFGNLDSKQKTRQVYTSLDYKWYVLENTQLQFGISHDYQHNKYKDSIPTYYYAQSESAPNYFSKTSIHNHILEAYLYTNWKVNDQLTLSSGLRSHLPIENQQYYLSSQIGLNYRIHKKHSFLLSSGKYHSYTIPNYYSKTYSLLSSHQIALDYTYTIKKTLLKAATYFKNEKGEQSPDIFSKSDKINTFGLELFIEHRFHKYFKWSFSNSFIDQNRTINQKKYKGAKDFNYLIKSTWHFNNPKLFSLALSYIGRPGTYYNEITSGVFDNQTNFYKPVFSNEFYSAQYESYHRFDISLSKYLPIKNNALITFCSLNNVFNTKNERLALYNHNYSNKHFDFHQFRTLFFGLVWQMN